MARDSIDDLEALLAVAREGSFTRAAVRLGVSQSALSQTVRAFETRIGLRLLTRTTRSVAPTEAGQRLLDSVGAQLESIREALAGLSDLRDTPTGTVRITADEHCAEAVLWPATSASPCGPPVSRSPSMPRQAWPEISNERRQWPPSAPSPRLRTAAPRVRSKP